MNFLIENWKFLVISFLVLLTLIVLLCKRTKLVTKDSALSYVIEKLPDLIKFAEITYNDSGLGESKLKLCLEFAKQFYLRVGGVIDNEESFDLMITNIIENILSTPTKKEVVYGEKK